MDTNGKIYITISDERGGKGGTSLSTKKNEDEKKQSKLASYLNHEFLGLVKSQSIKALNSSIASIGNLTGNYYGQMKVQESLSNLSSIGGIVFGALEGYKMSGGSPIGAVVGAGVVVVGQTVSWTFDRINFEASMNKQNKNIDLLRDRAGLNSTNNNNRGTEN